MKRRADWDDEWWYSPSLQNGSVHDLADSSPESTTAAILLVPDPEQRRGWREYYVRTDKPNERHEPMGFKPNGKETP
jgi:hypothetical protein